MAPQKWTLQASQKRGVYNASATAARCCGGEPSVFDFRMARNAAIVYQLRGSDATASVDGLAAVQRSQLTSVRCHCTAA